MSRLFEKSKIFALHSVSLYKALISRSEYVLSKQFLRSSTAVGANIAESNYAQSRADFVSKQSIALKEAAESAYWLDLLHDADYITHDEYTSASSECTELIRMLTASVKTAKSNLHSTQ